jgi:hypothetical protein
MLMTVSVTVALALAKIQVTTLITIATLEQTGRTY